MAINTWTSPLGLAVFFIAIGIMVLLFCIGGAITNSTKRKDQD